MNRLTIQGFSYDRNFVASNLQSWPIAQALKKLQAYEDAGLKPDEIPTGIELANVYAALEMLKKYKEIGTVEECRAAIANTCATCAHERAATLEPCYTCRRNPRRLAQYEDSYTPKHKPPKKDCPVGQ